MKIVHIAVRHTAGDVRILEKECRALAEAGHEVHFVVPEADCDERYGVRIHDVGAKRVVDVGGLGKTVARAYDVARKLDADVYHLHEPLLIWAGLKLKMKGATVVYDVHEDTPRQVRAYFAARPVFAIAVSLFFTVAEKMAKKWFDGFVCATPSIAAKYPAGKTVTVCNYPDYERFREGMGAECQYAARKSNIVYAGNITKTRGAVEMVEAVGSISEELGAKLVLLGRIDDVELEKELRLMEGWAQVEYRGFIDHREVIVEYGKAKMGLVLLHPVPNYIEALPVKMFEYMAAGLPVVASDFPMWREIIEDARCGVLVDPENPSVIAGAVRELLENPADAEQMGERGRKAVLGKYNWSAEAEGLLRFYKQMG